MRKLTVISTMTPNKTQIFVVSITLDGSGKRAVGSARDLASAVNEILSQAGFSPVPENADRNTVIHALRTQGIEVVFC